MSAGHRRKLAREAVEQQHCSQRQACRFFELNRSTYRYQAKYPSLHVLKVEREIVDQSLEHPELGADKIGRLVRNQGYRVSSERGRKVRREEGLKVPPPKKKERRRGPSTGRFRQEASYRGHVWTWDFIHDWTLKGGAFRVLSIVDEYTREVHALYVDRNIGSRKVRQVMEELICRQGAPAYTRSDNGPEPERSGDSQPQAARRASAARQFIATQLQEWLAMHEIKTLYIEPGCPWQNGYVESFHDKFRRECLARDKFYTLSESRVVIADWRDKYNHVRPHRSLGMATPKEFAAKELKPIPPPMKREQDSSSVAA